MRHQYEVTILQIVLNLTIQHTSRANLAVSCTDGNLGDFRAAAIVVTTIIRPWKFGRRTLGTCRISACPARSSILFFVLTNGVIHTTFLCLI
ncbi:uncharacterized protein A1O5_00277 [Cladophialophora psammophila CBS 110553]|uniref:Uncharacterized protein n=1 Tax=Cladophialophora psammophila CBS 110553 TaxID=1182543 RepID=W9XEJ0_9EURO|nr:uncharacterized protein A1O5_00277 [Cladophialophora psammophila CBS 110553]EXJ75770.1 hypothetical protein A1O5_00277 [Cladophialophora psammophila CBS 110553]